MAKYKVYEISTEWKKRVEVWEVEADSQEEAELNYQSGECVDSWEDRSLKIGVDPERTELIEDNEENY